MDKLVIGCGYLGRRVAALWKEGGHHVFATTRNTRHAQDLQQARLEPVVCDVLDVESLKALPRVESVVYCVGFDRQAGVPKREVYVQMDRGQVRKPRISLGKPVRWPDMAFGHLTLNPLTGELRAQEVEIRMSCNRGGCGAWAWSDSAGRWLCQGHCQVSRL